MKKTGYVVLPLHYGHAPAWLVDRMKALADQMVRVIVAEHGADGFLRNISDPYWFQAFGCVLGFDWHSSGLTTVVTGVLKDVLTRDRHGVAVAGGKGRASRGALSEIETASYGMSLSSPKIGELQYASRMCAKVDTSAVQAGYPIYHHAFFLTESGDWAVVQQGLDLSDRTARRYHWTSEHVRSFVEEPHNAVVGDSARKEVLNMTARDSEESRKISVDLVRGNPNNLISSIRSISSTPTMDRWTSSDSILNDPIQQFQAYELPSRINWNIFFDLYNVQPKNYEEVIALRGVGPSAVRALALVAQLIYGSSPSWKDPVKFSFAHGGKDGVPFPVHRRAMESSTRFIRQMLESCEADRQLKRDALVRLVRVERNWGV